MAMSQAAVEAPWIAVRVYGGKRGRKGELSRLQGAQAERTLFHFAWVASSAMVALVDLLHHSLSFGTFDPRLSRPTRSARWLNEHDQAKSE